VYAGYELFEHVAVRPGSEEYIDSEKYQIKVRDWAGAEAEGRSLAPYLARLNAIRHAHPALQQLRDLTIHRTDHDKILCFSKSARTPAGDVDTVLVVLNLDPHAPHETTVHLIMPALGMQWHDSFAVDDELSGQSWHWSEHNYVRLDPFVEPAHILSVRSYPR
jgi:starch synthase (maltosyl-transferring)